MYLRLACLLFCNVVPSFGARIRFAYLFQVICQRATTNIGHSICPGIAKSVQMNNNNNNIKSNDRRREKKSKTIPLAEPGVTSGSFNPFLPQMKKRPHRDRVQWRF